MKRNLHRTLILLLLSLGAVIPAFSQIDSLPAVKDSSDIALQHMKEQRKKWGPNDTIETPAIWYHSEIVSYRELEMAWVSNLKGDKLKKSIEEWNRLRNAVYVTYPYARIAGSTINDINQKMMIIDAKKERKTYLKTREKELKAEFSDPLTNLSVYQGKILMKLINRQTGNNCYDIIKEYKGGLNARFYQTVAWFVGGNLKQEWNLKENKLDRDIENIVKEIDGGWYANPYRR